MPTNIIFTKPKTPYSTTTKVETYNRMVVKKVKPLGRRWKL